MRYVPVTDAGEQAAREADSAAITAALAAAGGSPLRASEATGIALATLHRRIADLGLGGLVVRPTPAELGRASQAKRKATAEP